MTRRLSTVLLTEPQALICPHVKQSLKTMWKWTKDEFYYLTHDILQMKSDVFETKTGRPQKTHKFLFISIMEAEIFGEKPFGCLLSTTTFWFCCSFILLLLWIVWTWLQPWLSLAYWHSSVMERYDAVTGSQTRAEEWGTQGDGSLSPAWSWNYSWNNKNTQMLFH